MEGVTFPRTICACILDSETRGSSNGLRFAGPVAVYKHSEIFPVIRFSRFENLLSRWSDACFQPSGFSARLSSGQRLIRLHPEGYDHSQQQQAHTANEWQAVILGPGDYITSY